MALKHLIAVCAVCLFGLSGCVLTTAPGMALASITSVVTTDKTFGDHAVSLATGDDCSTVAYSQGRKYCVDDSQALTAADTAIYGPSGHYGEIGPFCYRTLGSVTCYNHPDPVASEDARIY